MAIAVNPDVRELDFSDNVKVSKFMQDFSDFRMKKWITYRPVNAPSESDPFYGGTRQFIINMGTGHIIDTTYSGLWYTIFFLNASNVVNWPIQASLPRTSSAWIESVTFQHSNVAAHIDERLCDYDSVCTAFTPAKEILSMKQTYFTTHGQTFLDNDAFNDIEADDPYGKMLKAGAIDTGRVNFIERSFFIPLNRLSTIFNSGKYFFPSLLRGNGEMTLSIRSVSQNLSEVFGGAGSSFSIYSGPAPGDKTWSTDADTKLAWAAFMTNMKLVTLNLDNAFLTKEYNAFIASGRKFIRSFKGYNYQFYQVKTGYNRIEIANTHQSISHIILAFQAPYSIRTNGRPSSALDSQCLGIQKTVAMEHVALVNNIAHGNFVLNPAAIANDGNINNQYQPAPAQREVAADQQNDPDVQPVALRQEAVNAARGGVMARIQDYVQENWAEVGPFVNRGLHMAVDLLPNGYQNGARFALGAVGHVLAAFMHNGQNHVPVPRNNILMNNQLANHVYEAYLNDYVYNQALPRGTNITERLTTAFEDTYGQFQPYMVGRGVVFDVNARKVHAVNSWTAAARRRTDNQKRAKYKYGKFMDMGLMTRAEAAFVAYMTAGEENLENMPTAVKDYFTAKGLTQAQLAEVEAIMAAQDMAAYGLNPRNIYEMFALARDRPQVEVRIAELVDNILPHNLVEQLNEEGEPQADPQLPFKPEQRKAIIEILAALLEDVDISWHKYHTHMLPSEAKQLFDLGMNNIKNLQVYRGTGNGETVFSEPVNENMFYHISREAMGDSAEDHPIFKYEAFRKDMAVIIISLNTFMRDAHHEFWDGFSTNRVADRLYVEFENTPVEIGTATSIMPWYHDIGYNDNCAKLNCKVFTVYDNIYYIDRNNNLNVSDTLLPLQEGRGPISE